MSHNQVLDESEQLSTKSALTVSAIAGVVAAAPLVALYVLAQAINPSTANASGDMSPAAIADRLRPIATFELVPAPKGPQTGQQVYEGLCTSCHTTGANGAPKIGAAGDWASRIPKGFEVLFTNANVGFNQMPAKGGNPKLSDLEIKRAIVYMTGKSGGNFPEPADDAAKADADKAAPAEGAKK